MRAMACRDVKDCHVLPDWHRRFGNAWKDALAWEWAHWPQQEKRRAAQAAHLSEMRTDEPAWWRVSGLSRDNR